MTVNAGDGERPPTLVDLAREANLSIATVSRAMRGHPAVNPETRRRVEELAAGLGYRTSATARALRTGRHDAIYLVLSEIALERGSIARGAARAARERGLRLLLHTVPDDSHAPGRAPSRHLEPFFAESVGLPVDGFIVVAPQGDKWTWQADRPLVSIDIDTPGHMGHTVTCDHKAAAKTATSHLIEMGRREIAAVRPSLADRRIEERLTGYVEQMNMQGLAPRVVSTPLLGAAAAGIPDVVEMLVNEGGPFDAVISLADSFDAALLRALQRHELRVPQDVAVVTFDLEIPALETGLTLTTVAEPTAEIGAIAVDTLFRLMRGGEQPPGVQRVPASLLPGHSSRAVLRP